MKCKCGKQAFIYVRGQHLCRDCYVPIETKSGDLPDAMNAVRRAIQEDVRKGAGLHIDIPATPANPRVQLCDGAPGDGIYHMTPTIAASYMAQHPDQQSEFCAGCLAVMYRDYLPTIAEARLYAASLK